VFVLPSREDPFPIVVLEAMALGLPVIGTSVDGIAEQITPDVGSLVPPDDPDALADAISDLAGSAERRRMLGAAARERVIRNFTVEHQAHLIGEAYAHALTRTA
jgi:glycosyltransferase involved in cell wall biosynthesis